MFMKLNLQKAIKNLHLKNRGTGFVYRTWETRGGIFKHKISGLKYPQNLEKRLFTLGNLGS